MPRPSSRDLPAPAPTVGGRGGLLFGALSVALFCAFTLVSRAGLTAALKPWDLVALRFGIGGLLLLPVLVRYGIANVAPHRAVALAFTGGVGFAGCAYAGFALAPAAHGAVLLHGTLPLTTLLLARAMGRAQQRSAGLALIALGVAAMAVEGAVGGTALQRLGDGALLLASLSWSAYGLLAQRFAVAPAHAALLTAAVPCVTTLGATVMLHESPSLLVLAGTALVTAGMLVSLVQRRPRTMPKA